MPSNDVTVEQIECHEPEASLGALFDSDRPDNKSLPRIVIELAVAHELSVSVQVRKQDALKLFDKTPIVIDNGELVDWELAMSLPSPGESYSPATLTLEFAETPKGGDIWLYNAPGRFDPLYAGTDGHTPQTAADGGERDTERAADDGPPCTGCGDSVSETHLLGPDGNPFCDSVCLNDHLETL